MKETQDLKAELVLSPQLTARVRSTFREFDDIFAVDAQGRARVPVVWPKRLGETKPDLTASVIEGGKRRLVEEVLKEIFR